MIPIKQKYIKSPLNYVGGKYKLLPQILPLFPKNIDTFIDLFGGGFNVGINVSAKEVVYNDLNLPVVEILEYIHRSKTDYILSEIDKIIEQYDLSKINRGGYLKLRGYYNKSVFKSPIILYTLICYAFNNQIRFNSKGEFNMPFGKDRSSFNPTLRERFVEFSETISNKDCKFTNADFREFIGVAFGENDFLYCDPPYFNSTATYNENGGWTNTDEEDLRDVLATSNVKWALSNNLKTNLTLKDWAENHDYKIHYLNTTYGNCNYQKKDKTKDIEVLITNY
jgi:DNA adenine methylase